MNILVKEIPETGLQLQFDSKTTPWFATVLADSLREIHSKKDSGFGSLQFFRVGVTVDCRGEISFDCHPTCSRCLKKFAQHGDFPIHLTLAPRDESERQLKLEHQAEVELDQEDLEFSYYKGDAFNLGDLLREQTILEVPVQPLCKQDCKGLCPHCGVDWNKETCQCQEAHPHPQWVALKGVRVQK
ncbi:MAG: DUF177 domain-containing protein [Deltaproteobacteria bacterium]|nr:DUF177 domain-containing protein [Deltaproteobacteria bacterium]